jgi:hypothetical protein
VNIKIAGKWMFIPLKMVLIDIDPYPCCWSPRSLVKLPTLLEISWRSQVLGESEGHVTNGESLRSPGEVGPPICALTLPRCPPFFKGDFTWKTGEHRWFEASEISDKSVKMGISIFCG